MKRTDMINYLIERLEFEFPGQFAIPSAMVAEIVLDAMEGKRMKPPKTPINTAYGLAFVDQWEEYTDEAIRYEEWLAKNSRSVG